MGQLLARARAAVSPLSPLSLLSVVAVTALLVAGQSSLGLHWGPLRWSETSAQFREGTALAGPAAGAMAAWTARVRHFIVCGVAPGRGWSNVVRRHLLVLASAAVLGLLLGLGPLVAQTLTRASVGGPSVLVMLSGMISLVAWVALGYLAGALLPARTGAALTLFGGLLVTIALPLMSDALTAGGAPRSLYSFSPVWRISVPLGWEEVTSTAAFRCVLAATIAAAAVIAAVSLDDSRERSSRYPSGFSVWLPFGAPAVLVIAALVVQPHLLRPREAQADVCSAASVVTVCLSDEEEALLPTAVSAVDEVLTLVGGPLSVDRLVWAGSADRDVPGAVVTGQDRTGSQADYRARFIRDFASGVSGVPSCSVRLANEVGTGVIPEGLSDSWAASSLIANALQVRLDVVPSDVPVYLDASTGAAAEDFVASLDDRALALWIGAHESSLATCGASLTDFAP